MNGGGFVYKQSDYQLFKDFVPTRYLGIYREHTKF
jgi:hypothetical protein